MDEVMAEQHPLPAAKRLVCHRDGDGDRDIDTDHPDAASRNFLRHPGLVYSMPLLKSAARKT